MEHEYYKIAKLIPKLEGEFIQELYFYFTEFKLDPEICDDYKGQLIPTLENISDMQEGLLQMFIERGLKIDKL